MNSFISRQPIFNALGQVTGYELCFQKDLNVLLGPDGPTLPATPMEPADTTLWWQALHQHKEVLIHLKDPQVIPRLIQYFDPSTTLLALSQEAMALLEEPEQVQALRAQGLRLAVFGMDLAFEEPNLFQQVSVVIFDLDRHDVVDLAGDFPLLHHHKKLVMLQGIENHETFDWGVEMGCHMFQGHFFQTPKQVVGRKLLGSQAMYFSLLREIHKPMMDYDKLEEIISKDAALVFKLLEYINSSAFHRRFRIRSVRHALSVLGEVEITKWVTFSLLSLVSTDKPPELLLTALIRAFFCHALAEKTANPALKNEAFFVGLMSVLDAMLDMSFSDIAKELPLSQRVLDAISGNGENELSVFLQLVQTYEDANWYKLHALAHKCSLNDLLLGELYLSAVCEADRTLTPSS